MSNSLSLEDATKKAQDVIKKKGALRLSGHCGVGKTSLCKKIMENYREETLKGLAFMITPRSREAVDDLSNEVLFKLLSSETSGTGVYAADSRPVKTPTALAFAILRKYDDNIRLLDVSDQTKLISEVVRKHVEHVSRGDECRICEKLKEYIHIHSNQLQDSSTTDSKFEKIFLSFGFVTKLREVFARFSELGIGLENKDILEFENSLAGLEENRRHDACLVWEIVQDLRLEYTEIIKREYPNYYDNSYMLLECRKKVEAEKTRQDLPKFIVVDDCQDLNLATFDLLEVLHTKGVPLIFVGNDDESVQKYKGAFPDVLSILETKGFEGPYSLESGYGKAAKTQFLQDAAENIGSWFQKEKALREAGRSKEIFNPSQPAFKCITSNSEEEEIASLRNGILSCMMSGKAKSWGDLAVIANSNAFLEKIGEDLKRNGIPFKYTAVNEELIKDSSVIKGMSSLMQLAYYASGRETIEKMRQDAFSLAVSALQSPLLDAEPTQVIKIKNIFQSVLSSLAVAENQENGQTKDGLEGFSVFRKWISWEEVEKKDKNLEAFFAFMLINPDDRKNILEKPSFREAKKDLGKLFDLLDKAKNVDSVPELFCRLWEDLKLAHKWQEKALKGDSEVGEWLDQLIRFQDLADTGNEMESVPDFLRRISDSYIEADSLAQIAPRDNRITLSTPSGVQSKRYEMVWVVDVQEKVWNKSVMEDLFATHLLESAATKNRVEKTNSEFIPADSESFRDRFEVEEKYSDWRNFLVASSRSDGETIFLSVSDQEHAPYHALNSLPPENPENNKSELDLDCLTVEGITEYCRVKLAKAILEEDEESAGDAAGALKILWDSGVEKANPKSWNFMRPAESTDAESMDDIKLNPSSVDGIWNTPVKQILQNNEGPIKSESHMQFGTDIHECAQWATETEKDRTESEDELKNDLSAYFRKLQNEHTDLSALYKGNYERKAKKAIDNLASYFAYDRNPKQSEYQKNIPPLEKASAEETIEVQLTLEDIYEIAKNTPGFEEITEDDFIEAMELLGGFKGLNSIKGKTINLKGKIDRLERREGRITYVIDYKTGSSYCDGIKAFSDLQLFCYQLLLHFNKKYPNVKEQFGDRAERSMLFSVEKEPYPASARSETAAKTVGKNEYGHYYQPCIFDASGTGFNRSENDRKKKRCNATPITGHVIGLETTSSDKLNNPVLQKLQIPKKDQDPDTWLPWIFYMFSKFFYAARYVDASRLQTREIDEKNSDQDLIEKVMTIYGMGQTINVDKGERCE